MNKLSFETVRRFLGTERAAEQYCNEEVDGQGRMQYLDKVGSVSAPQEQGQIAIFDDLVLDQQHRRFLNGS